MLMDWRNFRHRSRDAFHVFVPCLYNRNVHQTATKRISLTRFAWLSIAAAITTILLKAAAFLFTGSVGLLSDALESLINLAGGLMALAMLTIAERPADEEHAYGHTKAEYFSSGVEGGLILVAAFGIGFAALQRLANPQPLEQVGLGLLVSVSASLINLGAALVLRRAGKKYNSIALESDAKHLLTDVWTSVGVIVGVGAVALTDWERLDPIVALLVAANIIWSGVKIMRKSAQGLMDTALPPVEINAIEKVLASYTAYGVQCHAFRSRQSGSRRFVSFHVLVPNEWTVQRAHQLVEQMEADVRNAVSNITVFTHLEPLNDPASFADMKLDREQPMPEGIRAA
jgi:cation diffusion facilitator family transporter